MRRARACNFWLVACTLTIRLLNVLPSLIITPVEIMLSTSFCAVPALSRVEPVRTSGPVTGAMLTSARSLMGEG